MPPPHTILYYSFYTLNQILLEQGDPEEYRRRWAANKVALTFNDGGGSVTHSEHIITQFWITAVSGNASASSAAAAADKSQASGIKASPITSKPHDAGSSTR